MMRRLSVRLALLLTVLVAALSPLTIDSVWAAGALWAPAHVERPNSITRQPDIFRAPIANTTPVGQPGGPTVNGHLKVPSFGQVKVPTRRSFLLALTSS